MPPRPVLLGCALVVAILGTMGHSAAAGPAGGSGVVTLTGHSSSGAVVCSEPVAFRLVADTTSGVGQIEIDSPSVPILSPMCDRGGFLIQPLVGACTGSSLGPVRCVAAYSSGTQVDITLGASGAVSGGVVWGNGAGYTLSGTVQRVA